MKKRVWILVGLPGSGKSTAAATMAKNVRAMGLSCEIHSTNEYFVNSRGEYEFNPSQLVYNHQLNQESFEDSLIQDVDVVIVDNTNLRRVHREIYAEMAREFRYDVTYKVIGRFDSTSIFAYFTRGTHRVPLGTIARQAQGYEPPTREEGLVLCQVD